MIDDHYLLGGKDAVAAQLYSAEAKDPIHVP
jgi:hypothetical protein